MFKPIICALFVTAVSASTFSKHLQEILEKHRNDKIHLPLDLPLLSRRESIGHQLKDQLKNVAVSSLTNSVSGVLDKALGALTEKAVSGITNLLGHIHLGKRYVFGDLKGDINQKVKDLLHKEKELLNEYLHHQKNTRSTGSELREALKGALVNSATGAITTVVDTAISGLTSALTSGLTNILGHIGKREAVNGNFQTMIGNFEHHLKTDLSTISRPLKEYILTEAISHQNQLVARRNIFGDIGKLIGNEVKQIGEGALGSLGQLATDKLNGLISKLGRREAEDLSSAFSGVAEQFSTAITDALAELPEIIAQELGPLIAQFTGYQ